LAGYSPERTCGERSRTSRKITQSREEIEKVKPQIPANYLD